MAGGDTAMGTETGECSALCENDIIVRSGVGGQGVNSRQLLLLSFLSRTLLSRTILPAQQGHELTTALDWDAGQLSKLKQKTTRKYF